MYHYADGDVPRGPVPKEALKGRVSPQTLVWREGMADWLPAGTLPELADLFGAPTPPAAPPSDPAPIVATAEPAAATPVAVTPAALAAASAVPIAQSLPQSYAPPVQTPPNPTPTPVDYSRYGPPSPTDTPPGMAIASMILGIVGIMMFCAYGIGVIPSILAVVFGYIARGQGAVGNNQGAGMATAGIIMGWVPIALLIVGIILIIGVVIVSAAAQ